MNASLHTADRLTHLKIVMVSLVTCIVVVGSALAARPTVPDRSTQLEMRAPIPKVIWTGNEGQSSADRVISL